MTQSRMLGVFDSLASDVLRAFPYRCAVMRNRNSTCTRCAQACTTGAISISEDEVVVDSDLCVGCGTCATVCPTCALEANNPCDAVLEQSACDAMIRAAGCAVIMCDAAWDRYSSVVDAEKISRVRCLGRVEESLLLCLVASGADSVVLVRGACGTCPRVVGKETYESVIQTTHQLLDAWGSPVRIELKQQPPSEILKPGKQEFLKAMPFDETRRNLFNAAAQSIAQAVRATLTHDDGSLETGFDHEAIETFVDEGGRAQAARFMKTMKDGTLPHFIPDRRERLLDALAEIGSPRDVTLDTRLWGRVSIDTTRCISCYACATFCPTGAIMKFKTDNEEGIYHTPADCVKCRCCTDICPTHALSLHEDVMARVVAEGSAPDRWVFPGNTQDRGGAHSILASMKKQLKIKEVYER